MTGETPGFQKGGDLRGVWEGRGLGGRCEERRPLCQSRHCLLVSATWRGASLLCVAEEKQERVNNLPGHLGTAGKCQARIETSFPDSNSSALPTTPQLPQARAGHQQIKRKV